MKINIKNQKNDKQKSLNKTKKIFKKSKKNQPKCLNFFLLFNFKYLLFFYKKEVKFCF